MMCIDKHPDREGAYFVCIRSDQFLKNWGNAISLIIFGLRLGLFGKTYAIFNNTVSMNDMQIGSHSS